MSMQLSRLFLLPISAYEMQESGGKLARGETLCHVILTATTRPKFCRLGFRSWPGLWPYMVRKHFFVGMEKRDLDSVLAENFNDRYRLRAL
jgi:hypothetical protein